MFYSMCHLGEVMCFHVVKLRLQQDKKIAQKSNTGLQLAQKLIMSKHSLLIPHDEVSQ